jgi:ATP-dependent DNA ligase
MEIKQILDEISSEPGKKQKMAILGKYVDNELLKSVLYMANSGRVKFYIKQIPEYTRKAEQTNTLDFVINELEHISRREVTGNDALRFLSDLLATLNPNDAYVVERIIEKNLKIGMDSSINKVFENLIEETPYMGAVSFNEKKARKLFEKGRKAYSQVKMDGRYCNAILSDGAVYLESRQGEPTIVTGAKFLGFLNELALMNEVVLNGELTMDGVPRYESNGIIASIIDICGKRGERTEKENSKKLSTFESKHGNFEEALAKIRYTVWDMITVDEFNVASSKTPYNTRLKNLENVLFGNEQTSSMVSTIENREVNTFEEAMEHFKEILGRGEEGTILKAQTGEWKDGKPVWQIKLKLELTLDLVITGFNYGTKGTKNEHVVSSLNAETSCGLLKTRPQGLTEDLMDEITENQENLLGTIIEVKCSGLSFDNTGAYSLLYPSFKHFRDDKGVANSLKECIEIQNAALGLS